MPKTIDLTKKERPKRVGAMMLELADAEKDMLADLSRAYGMMWRGKPNKQGMIKYLIRAAFGMLTRGEKI